MNIISVDLPWNPDKRGSRALAIADLNKKIKILTADDDPQMLQLISQNIEPESLVLLDVPVDGCDNLGSQHFRPVDKALHRTIPMLPTSKAKDRGKKLKELIQSNSQEKRVIVQEIYPYAIYKFLAYLRNRKLLQRLALDKFDTLLDDGFRIFSPPRYKRERKESKRLENMGYLYSLLTDSSLGLRFSPSDSLHRPDTSCNLNRLSDEYDACLGAIVGVYFASKSSYACIAGDAKSGNMLILADQWLIERLRLEVPVYRLAKGIQGDDKVSHQ